MRSQFSEQETSWGEGQSGGGRLACPGHQNAHQEDPRRSVSCRATVEAGSPNAAIFHLFHLMAHINY